MVSESSEHFDRLAPRYAELRASPEFVDPVAERVAALTGLWGKRVLDVGCRPGGMLRQLVEAFGAEAVGIDPSGPMVAAAREAAPDAEVVVGSAEELPFEDRSFDVLLLRLSVHHLERGRAFPEFLRVLRAGGRVAITTTDPDAVHTFWLARYFPSSAPIEQKRFPGARALCRELAAAGFTHVEAEPFVLPRTFGRGAALETLLCRAYSTFVLLDEAEIDAGLALAERDLPDVVSYEPRLLNVVAERP
jgi:ubiquinone/menaquinone biosynthesis C-methylase UbiE